MPRRRPPRQIVQAFVTFILILLAATVWGATPASAEIRQLSPAQQQALDSYLESRSAEVERAAESRSAERTQTPPEAAPAPPAASRPAGTLPPPAPAAEPRAQTQAEGATDTALADLMRVLQDPDARRALQALLQATDAAPPQTGATAAQATPPPGPGIGPGTGLTGMAGAAVAALSRAEPAPGAATAAADATAAAAPPASGDPSASAASGDAAAPDSPAAETAPATPLLAPDISVLTEVFRKLYEDAVWASGITTQVPQLADWLALQFDDDTRGVWLHLSWQIGLVLLAGALAAMLARLAIMGPARRLRDKAVETASGRRLVLLLTRLVLVLLPIALFVVAAQAVLPLIEADLRTELVASVIITGLVVLRAAMLILHALLSPRQPGMRMIPVSDETARLLHRGFWRASLGLVLGYMTVEVARLLGMPPGGRTLLTNVFGLALLVVTVHTLVALRGVGKQAIRRITLGGGSSMAWLNGLLRGLADIWHLLAAAYAIGIFFAWVIDADRWFAVAGWATVKTLIIFFLTLVLFGWVQRLRDAGMMRLHASERLDRAARQRVRRYLGLAATVGRVVLVLGALVLILDAWHLNVAAWLTTGLAERVVTMAFNVALVLAVSVALWEGVNQVIHRYLTSTDQQGTMIERGQRERTLLPLLRNVLTVFLVVVVSLILLSEVGVDIAPLLAGAGVVGLAIGFGSQKLVQDVISGIFNLLEDTIAVGDVVQVGGHAGVVEAMSIRSLRLRDLSGNLHTIPFSGVDTVTNMTKDYSYYLMDVGVAYRENTDHVTQVLVEVGEELRQDREYGPSILEPLEVLGVDGFHDSAVIIKARIKTKPIMQWWVGREFNRRMKHRFDALGIEIPFPHMTVYFGVDKEGNAPPAHLHVDRLAAMGHRFAQGTPPAATAMPEPSVSTPVSLPDPEGDSGPGEGGR